jgi:hypothetical protein
LAVQSVFSPGRITPFGTLFSHITKASVMALD